MSKHANGPWYAKSNPEYPNSKWRIDSKPNQSWGNFGEIAMVSGEANAKLIAASPMLLEALKALVERIDYNGGIGEYKGGPSFVMKHAREAIAAAEE